MHRYILTVLWLIITYAAVTAQTNSSGLGEKIPSGSFAPAIKEKTYHPDSTHRPHTAVMRSLFLPGLGQLYNHRWWKVPIIYTGIGFCGVVAVLNQKSYKLYSALAILKREYSAALSSPQNRNYALYQKYKVEYVTYKGLSEADAANYADYFQRYRDLSILGVMAFWTINALDAYIDAKFINSFSVDNNLTIKPVSDVTGQPVYAGNSMGSFNPGLKITFVMR